MEHAVSFLLLLAFASAAVLSTMAFMLGRQYRHKASLWFGVVAAGVGCFVAEILVYRYGTALGAPGVVESSQLWALLGGCAVTLGTPRLARLLTGSPRGAFWRVAEPALPAATAALGLCLVMRIGGGWVVAALQALVFGSVAAGIAYIALARPKPAGNADGRFLLPPLLWTALCLPPIIADAVGGWLPAAANDLPMALFLPGLFAIAIARIPRRFGRPTLLSGGRPSEYFAERFGISKREAEVVALVVEGEDNAAIADRLFISVKTVENHLTSVFRKTGAKNRIQLFRLLNSSSD